MSGGRQHEEVPRSEGDLRIYWDERDGRITEAWCQGTLYRGYEMILAGRYPEDALATTARLCGICSTCSMPTGYGCCGIRRWPTTTWGLFTGR